MPERMLRRAGADAALVLAARAVAAIALVALTPLIVGELGKPAYGVWVIVSAATGLVGLVDVGVAPGLARVVAFAAARGDDAAVRAAAATAALMSLALGALVVAAGWILAPALAGALDLPDALAHDAARALRLAFIAFGLTALSAICEGVLIGRQRFRMLVAVRTTYIAGFVLAAVATLRAGGGVVGLAASQAGAMALALAVGLLACRPAARPPGWWAPRRASVGPLLRFGLPQQGSRLAYAGALHYERLLVGVLIGASAAAEYGAASVVVAAVCSLLAQASVVLVPVLTRLEIREPARLGEAFGRSAVAFAAVAAGTFGLLAATAAPLIAGWLGDGFAPAAGYVQVLAVGFLLWSIAHPGFALVQALGRPALEARGAGVVVLVNAAATTTLLLLVGAGAIALGTSAALALGAFAFWLAAGRAVPHMRGSIASPARPLSAAVPLAAGFALANELLLPAQQGRPAALALAAGEALLFVAAYVAALVRLGCVRRDALAAALARGRRRSSPVAPAPDPETA